MEPVPPALHQPTVGPRETVPARRAPLQIGMRPARVLVIDDDPWVGTATRRALEPLGAIVQAAPSAAEGLAAARAAPPDLVILDSTLPDGEGFAVLERLREEAATHAAPVLFLGADDDPNTEVQALEHGAAHYLVKPFILPRLVARVLAMVRQRSREEGLRQRVRFLEELAVSDPLTTLRNRCALEEGLYLEAERARQRHHPLSCVVLDIDGFKAINDRYGHRVGDEVLAQVAKTILERRRERDVVGRYGGEEFVWLMPEVGREMALELAEWLRRTIEEMEIPTGEESFTFTVSLGVSTYAWKEHGVVSADLLFEAADRALLRAKAAGKNKVVFMDLLQAVAEKEGPRRRPGTEGTLPVETATGS